MKLISGYIQVDTGKIIVDEQHLKKVSLKSYYQHIGYLTQEPSVFDGTVLENLTYGMSLLPSSSVLTKEGAQELPLNPPQLRGKARNEQGELLHQILKLAKCEFIYDLPNGLDTEI
ncbi:MAG: ABC transporter ATP-binding protein [Candidatus Peribacteria bacterium]|nr:MAG: ABC transporter ATP-binding protein [Candidatus Peribacteria bacterium]